MDTWCNFDKNSIYLKILGWDHIQTIDSLLRKGGYRGHINQEVRESIQLTRYQSSETHMTYSEYRDIAERRHMNKANGC